MAKKMTNMEILEKGAKLHFKYLECVDQNRQSVSIYHMNMGSEDARQDVVRSLDECSRAYRNFQSFIYRHRVTWDKDGYTLALNGVTMKLFYSIEHKADELFGLYKMNYGIAKEAERNFNSHSNEEMQKFWNDTLDDCEASYKRYLSFCAQHGLDPKEKLTVYS